MKKCFLPLMVVFSMITSQLCAETVIMTRESGAAAGIWEKSNAGDWSGASGGTLNVSTANPVTTGINSSSVCIRSQRNSSNWKDHGKIWGNAITVDANNCYLHFMVYSSTAGQGMIVIKPNNQGGDQFETHQGEGKGTDIRFNIPAGVWTDMVFNLQDRGISLFSEIYFADQYWSGTNTRDHYYDEIILDCNPNPRTSHTQICLPKDLTPAITINNVVANFETITPTFSIDDSAMQTLSVVNNPDKVLNHTSKVLYGKVSGSGGNDWGGLKVSCNALAITNSNRYLHIFVKTDLPYFEFIGNPDNDNKWAKKCYVTTPGWFDYVVDIKQTNLNLNTLNYFRLAVYKNQTAHRNKEIWIDEIVANNDPNPRSYFTVESASASSLYGYTNNTDTHGNSRYYHNDIVFKSTDANTGQITGITPAGLSPTGAVVLKKNVTKQWYPIGFPFALDGVYADLLNIDFENQLAARYAFDDSWKNEAGVAFESFAAKRGTGSAPTLVANTARPGSSTSNQVLSQSSGSAQNESLTRFTNPLQGAATTAGFSVSLWVNWDGSNGNGCIGAFSDPAFGRLFVSPNSGLAYENTVGNNGFEITGFTPLTSGVWKLLTLTFTDSDIVLYVNGVAVNDQNDLTWIDSDDYASLLTFISTVPYFYLGYGSGNGSAPILADDLLFYKKALSAGEVAHLYKLYTQIYPNYEVGKYGIKLIAAADKQDPDGDFWLQAYNGDDDIFEYISVNEMAANKGYVIQFPTYFNNKEISFVSSGTPLLKNTTSNTILSSFTGYALVANPSLNNISSLDEIAGAVNGAYYVYNSSAQNNNFGLVDNYYSITLKPFESLGIAREYSGPLRSSLGTEVITHLDRILENDPVIETQYYNLQGMRVISTDSASGGIYIVKKVFSSGKTSVTKQTR